MFKLRLILVFFLFYSVQLSAQRSQAAPENKLRTYVTDKTGTLSSSETTSLETKLANFDKQTSTQVVVYIISTLDGESLEDKSYEIAEQNGIGRKSKNNGVLLFIVKDDRKLRIEVGYGLEGALPDATCDQIIRKEITPAFKQAKYYDGINAGVDAIIKATKGEYKNDTKEKNDDDYICGMPILAVIIIFLIFFFVIMPIVSRVCGWSKGGSGFFGGSGGWSSGGSGSSWSGGGGFSGGGGSFGGGGASGSW